MNRDDHREGVEPPTVSVCMITFNHEEYVTTAIESVLAQQAPFTYELVIGDDCSTDRTRVICETYALQHPGTVRVLAAERNLGVMDNFLRTFGSCRGEFIALCEGDDFWTDPLKLRKQVEALRSQPALSMAATTTMVLYQETQETHHPAWAHSPFTIKDMLRANYLGQATCSILLRRDRISASDLELLAQSPFGDWALSLFCLSKGDGVFLRDTMACYRIHARGAWNGLTKRQQWLGILAMFDFIERHWPEHAAAVARYRLDAQTELARLDRREGACSG